MKFNEFFEFPEVIYSDNFGVEYIPKEIMKRIRNKNIKSNIFRIQDNNSIMCGYFCILFIEYMLDNKTLTDFTNLFSPGDFKKNDEIIIEEISNDGRNKLEYKVFYRRSK